MKKLLIYIFLSSLVGCNEPEEWIGNGSGYSKYLVQNYVDGSYVLYGMLAEKPSTLYSMSGFQVLLEDPVYYQTPEQEGAQHTDDFLRIAERNHDTEYNNLKSLPWSDLTAFADNFTGIKVTSDKDWSAKYPAGSPLNFTPSITACPPTVQTLPIPCRILPTPMRARLSCIFFIIARTRARRQPHNVKKD